MDRKQIKAYGKASGDRNPIHMNDEFAEQMGLGGVIAHGMLFFGHMGVFVDEKALEWGGKVLTLGGEMRGTVRPGDWVITDLEVTKVDGKVVHFDINQYSKMPLKIEKDGAVVKTFEGEEKNWVKDKEKEGIATEETDEGTLTYRKWISIIGKASIELP